MALHTLRRMAAGGIRDHLGGGFHRYSVDARWLVPHFEKMLYDNALLARVYLDAYRLTGEEDLREVAEQHARLSPGRTCAPRRAASISARDADSEGEEGRFYVWTPDQVLAALPAEEARLFMRCYDVTRGGQLRRGQHPRGFPMTCESVARAEGIGRAGPRPAPGGARATLLRAPRRARGAALPRREGPRRVERDGRSGPWRKPAVRWAETTTSRAAADGADLPPRRDPARREAAAHVGRTASRGSRASSRTHGALGNALLSLHEATLDPAGWHEAHWCCEEILARFWDARRTASSTTAPTRRGALFLRPRDPMDNATPSGNSLAAELLLRAGHLFGEARLPRMSRERVLAREAGAMRRFPTAFGRLLSALDRPGGAGGGRGGRRARGDADDPGPPGAALAPFHRNRTVAGRRRSPRGGQSRCWKAATRSTEGRRRTSAGGTPAERRSRTPTRSTRR